jgi:hypothetical protein
VVPKVPDLELDLPAQRPAAQKPAARVERPEMDLDLDLEVAPAKPKQPALAAQGRTPFDDLDLPTPKDPDRRSLIEQADEAFGDLDLPMPRSAASSAFGDLDLPAPRSDRPAPKKGGSGDVDLPAPRSDLPALKKGFGDLDLRAARCFRSSCAQGRRRRRS